MDYFKFLKEHPHLVQNEGAAFKIVTDPQIIVDWEHQCRKSLQENSLPVSFSKIGIVFSDPYIYVLRDLVRFPNDDLGGYARVVSKGNLDGGYGIAVLGIFGGRILLLNNYRHATRSWHLEIPRGYGEPNITAVENAKRELVEEVNAKVISMIDLGPFHPNSGLEDLCAQLFFAELSQIGEPELNEGIINFKLVKPQDFEMMIVNSKITDGFTIAAYTRAKLKGLI